MPSAAAAAAYAARKKEEESNSISNASLSILLGTASDIVNKVSSESSVFDLTMENSFSRFAYSELNLGRVLGRGGFCVVNEIKSISLSNDILVEETSNVADYQTRGYISKHCIRDGDCRYAIKILSSECTSNPALFLKGTVDLAIEARFLAVINHPNIIKMRAMADVGYFDEGFFLVLDRLYDTLEQRLVKWKGREKNAKGVIGKLTKGKKKRTKLLSERLNVSWDLSRALKHLHSLNIIYRDLKPENIGFDVRGDVKIFDLGLAKELKDADRYEDGTYKLTGFTGSLRYMAPEIAKEEPYNLSADVYSFGILFWQIISLEPPFNTYSCKMHDDLVVHKGYRPACNKEWPASMSSIMRKCWSHQAKQRPSIDQVSSSLIELASQFCEDGTEEVALDISQRSARAYRAN